MEKNKKNSDFTDLSAEIKSKILEAIEYAVFVLDSEGNILYSNQKNAELHEYLISDFRGMNIRNVVSGEFLNEALEHIHTAIELGRTSLEEVHIKKTGQKFPVEVFYSTIKINSKKYILGTIRDLTAVKNLIAKKKGPSDIKGFKTVALDVLEDLAKEKNNLERALEEIKKFKMATDSASDHIVITDTDGVILYANKAVEKITGFNHKEIINKKAGSSELWGGLMDKEFYKSLWDSIKNQKKPFKGEIKNKRKNGEPYDSFATISPVLDEHGELKFFVGTERDITKEKEIDKSKSEFVSLASHQLRTPLTAVRWYTENLMETSSEMTNEQKDAIHEIYAATLRMTELVRSLLNVSRIELSTFSIDPKDVSLSDLITSIIKELDIRIKSKKLNVVFNSSLKSDILSADPVILRMLFDNLISNAVKYTDEKDKIDINLYEKDEFVCFEVKDTGCGIPDKQKEKIFGKFFRADNAVDRETDGNGLGLYMVKEVTEKIGGDIYFESTEGEGSVFILSIPKSGMRKVEGVKALEM